MNNVMKNTKMIILFLFLIFSVSFVSDIVLNDLSTHFNIIKSLQPYFYKQSILKCAFDAGITVLVAVLINIFFSYFLFGFVIPDTSIQLIYFCILAFLIGYIIDIFIYKFNLFGNRLTKYYNEYGAGLWGAIAFVFAIIISYVISYFIKKYIL
jgi:hypothetical protein